MRKNPKHVRGSNRGRGALITVLVAGICLSTLGLVVGADLLQNRIALWGGLHAHKTTSQTNNDETSKPGPAPVTLNMEGFDPNHLIDDEVFYNSEAMTAPEITSFINQVNDGCVPGPDGTVCLSRATIDTEDLDPTTTCPGGYEGAIGESAADIIAKVAAACDINPQVLLVLLQKEQGLLTASGQSLTDTDYTSATGYSCPDGSTCDRHWSGLFWQLYGAASQFQRYRLDPGSYRVVAGEPHELAYSPQADCGSAPLLAANQATAGLYAYTPYQPNAAAWQGGDACTSWGNWNFYGYFRTWFGDPTPST